MEHTALFQSRSFTPPGRLRSTAELRWCCAVRKRMHNEYRTDVQYVDTARIAAMNSRMISRAVKRI